MKFLLRSLIVLAIAVLLGVGLYYVVQALPDNLPGVSEGRPPEPRFENGQPPEGFQPRPDRPEGGFERGEGGLSLFSLIGVAGKMIMFAVLTAGAVIVHKLISGMTKKKG